MEDYNNNAALTLCPDGTDIVAAHLDKRSHLKNIAEPEGVETCYRFAQGACILRGIRVDTDGLKLTAAALFAELRRDFPHISITEIGHAIKEGCFEKYGEVYGINAVSLYKMVEGFVRSMEFEDICRKAVQHSAEQAMKNAQWLLQHPDYKKSTL